MKQLPFVTILLFLFLQQAFAQVTVYTKPPGLLITDPLPTYQTNAKNIAPYKTGNNSEFNVLIKDSNNNTQWQELFTYNTFVNSSSGNLRESQNATFVTFDLKGTATIEITCNNYSGENLTAADVMIRPLSKGILPDVTGNKITFTVSSQSQYSVEIKGDRYKCLNIFANEEYNYVPERPTVVYDAGIHMYDTKLNDSPKKIYLKEGAVLRVPYKSDGNLNITGRIILQSGDEIYIEKGGILNGGIMATDAKNIKIHGHGIIDLTNYPKQYDDVDDTIKYAYVKGLWFQECSEIVLNGLTINDPQHYAIGLIKCHNIVIENIKCFSRVSWGDGIHMEGTSNVTINNCFFRNSDDCIAIYAERHGDIATESYTYRNAENITCKNTIFYADRGHPIEIGWHGDWHTGRSLKLQNIQFTGINILEHDEKWEDSDGNYNPIYYGAISINCGDNTICSDFLFQDIFIEDFTSGRLFSVNAEPAYPGPDGSCGTTCAPGKKVTDIRFKNIVYNGTGERPSSIKGVDNSHYVKKIYFENLIINGKLIKHPEDYTDNNGNPLFDINEFARRISFK